MNSPLAEQIRAFLAGGPWAVVGATSDRTKYGNRVLRCYQQHGKSPLYPVNPRASEIEGLPAYASLKACPTPVRAVSFITPPAITAAALEDVVELGILHVWMQPGAEGREALARAQAAGIEAIAGGPCLLVVLGYRE